MTARVLMILTATGLLAVGTATVAGGSPPQDATVEPTCVIAGASEGLTSEGVRFGLSAITCEP